MKIKFSRTAQALCLTCAHILGAAQGGPAKPKTIKLKPPQINWNYIAPLEGTRLNGYVPVNRKTGKVLDHSGVTVGNGVDIGQHSKGEIAHLPIPAQLKEKLEPCAGKKKNKAVSCLEKHPLKITPSENTRLTKAIRKDETKKVVKSYDAHSTGKNDTFVQLPSGPQTAVASMHYQYGNKMNKKMSGVLEEVHKGHFPHAAEKLKNVPDKYATRHRKEAKLMSSIHPRLPRP